MGLDNSRRVCVDHEFPGSPSLVLRRGNAGGLAFADNTDACPDGAPTRTYDIVVADTTITYNDITVSDTFGVAYQPRNSVRPRTRMHRNWLLSNPLRAEYRIFADGWHEG